MFSPLQYSYAADDEYDTRKLKTMINNYIFVQLNSSSPTITPTDENATEKSRKILLNFSSKKFFYLIRHIYLIYLLGIMHGVRYYNKQKFVDVNVVKQHLNILNVHYFVYHLIINYVVYVLN
jgi:hypothetical protein